MIRRVAIAAIAAIISAAPAAAQMLSGLPPPTSSGLGGVKALTASSHQFLTGLGTDGVLTRAQPGCGDLSDAVSTCNSLASPLFIGTVRVTGSSTAGLLYGSDGQSNAGARTMLGLGYRNGNGSFSGNLIELNAAGAFDDATEIGFKTNSSGAPTNRWKIGKSGGFYSASATGTDKGADTANVGAGYYNNGVLAISATAPTISSGFGASPSVTANNGTLTFDINVGTGGSASSGVIGLPTAPTGWHCIAQDITTQSSTVFVTKQTASSTTSCTVGNFNTSGAAAAWAASDHLRVSAFPY